MRRAGIRFTPYYWPRIGDFLPTFKNVSKLTDSYTTFIYDITLDHARGFEYRVKEPMMAKGKRRRVTGLALGATLLLVAAGAAAVRGGVPGKVRSRFSKDSDS